MLKAHPEGTSTKVIADTFRSRMKGGKEDINKLALMLRRLGKQVKKGGPICLRDEFL